MDFFEIRNKVKPIKTEELFDWKRAVESELEIRGECSSFNPPKSGVSIGQGVYRIGEHIPAGTYAFHLVNQISRDAANCSHLFLFEDMDAYHQHIQKNNGHLGTIPTFSVYHNSPVSCLEVSSGQVLAVLYNAVVISKFQLEL